MTQIAFDKATVLNVDNIRTITLKKGRREQINHRKNYGLFFCLDGQLVFTHRGERVTVEPECAVFLPQWESYELVCTKGGHFPLIDFQTVQPLCETVTALPMADVRSCVRDCETLRNLRLSPGNRMKMLSIFYELLHRIEDCGKSEGNILAPAERMIDSDYNNPGLSNLSLARVCGISEVYFRKLFSERHGVSPRQYIIAARVERAKQLLSEGNKKISAISEESGFSNPYHFCRVFKERTGMTPTDYAKRYSYDTFS